MVDAFVGGVGILLILTVLSAFQSVEAGKRPHADVVITCVGETETVRVDMRPSPIELPLSDRNALPRQLAELAGPAALSYRVLIKTTPANQICALKARRALNQANDQAEIGRLGYPAPVFLIDISWTEPGGADRG